MCRAVSSSSSLILLFSPFTRIMSAWIPFGSAFQFPTATQTPQLLLWDATCPPQLRPGAIRKLSPRCCGDLRTVGGKIQLFQQRRVTQRLKQICGSICSLGVFVKAPAVFCQKQSVENTLGLRPLQGTQSILNPYSQQINSNSYDNFAILTMFLNPCNFQQTRINTRRKQENLQPFLSARHFQKFAFFKWSHLALRTFCHALAGICEQPAKSNSSSSGD